MAKKVIGTALVQELCPICTRETDNSILINTRLSESAALEVNKLNNSVKWAEHYCDECSEMHKKGFILIGAVEDKTTDATNPYRSGNIWVVKNEVAEQIFGKKLPPKGIAFIDVKVAHQMELPGVNLNA